MRVPFVRGESEEEQRQRLLSEQARQDLQQQGVSVAHNQARDGQRTDGADSLLKIVAPDIDDRRVPPELANMISRELPLANLEDAEVNEVRWMSRAIELWIRSMHPPGESVMQGRTREILGRDPDDGLTALSHDDELGIRQLAETLAIRATRGRDGWQQKQFRTSYAVSEVVDHDEEDSGGWLSL